MSECNNINNDKKTVRVNGREYRWPVQPTVVVCFDGCDPEYIDAASKAGLIPNIDSMRSSGFASKALACMPTFTNPNNVSIVCGVPPNVHGVSGNFYFDRETGKDVMMVDSTPVRAPTLLAAFSRAGAKVVAITAKDKLRKALGKDLDGIAFSAEKANEATQAENGISNVEALVGRHAPDQYSADLSLFVLDAGIKLLETHRPDISYLSLSDYVQHKHAPDDPAALEFMVAVDQRLGKMLALGARLGIVADHGMSDMADAEGNPRIVYLADRLSAAFGADKCRVICPITDPFVRHHGALGGFVRIHLLTPDIDIHEVLAFVRAIPGVALALPRDEVCLKFDVADDREGDIAVIATKGVALGAGKADHDLSQLSGTRLRSHGGLTEQVVPFITSIPVKANPTHRLRNFDIFCAVLNEAL
ncbi:phosphonoacetate hydrolase [Buttiauxella warmboldiae]|uniref:Phosphonoacetate hydrolase n=2 Tax=Buttiauxella warmboldiae TaxID=82993 RepID=A0A3N5DNV8_9ENTR|nr:phosphonoacetate hydrolase [Buttiauxella warmboldiae]